MIIRVKHLRAVGICNREPRIWCKQHGLDWSEFVLHGFDDSVLLATGDPMALKVVEAARREAADAQ